MTITDIAASRHAELVRANGIEIAYTDVGSGPPLILLPGVFVSAGPAWAGSPAAWVDHVPVLAERFRVITPDTRGAGATVHPGGPATFTTLSEDVIALIERLGLDRPVIAGFSEGGATATIVALRSPELVGALVNHAGFDIFDPEAMAHQMLRPMFGGGPDATTADPDATERAFQAIPPMATTFATMKADFDQAQGEGHWRAYVHQFFDRAAAPLGYGLDDLAALAVPTLILGGDRDPFCPVEAACDVYRRMEGGALGIVPDTGHEISPAVVRVMSDFLVSVADG